MKHLISIALIALSVSAYSQKTIYKSEYDKFLKTYRIETYAADLVNGLSNKTWIQFRSNDSLMFLVHGGVGSMYSHVIGAQDALMLLLANEDVLEVRSKEVQGVNVGSYAGTIVRSFKHEYFIETDAIALLKKSPVKSVRVYTSNGYYDYDVPQKNAAKLMIVARDFLGEFQKQSPE